MVFTFNLKLLYTVFLHSITVSRYKVGKKFDENSLAVEQNNYTTKIVNASIVYKLDVRPKVSLDNFKLKNCFFGATNIVKNSDKEKREYSGYGIAFSGDFWC